jgi:phospholipase C
MRLAPLSPLLLVALTVSVAACGGTSETSSAITVDPDAEVDGGEDVAISDDASVTDVAVDAPPVDAPPVETRIKHVVLIVQENHTFDNYFGRCCTAAPGSEPTCTTGPGCCEAAPAKEPSGSSPVVLDDAENGGRDPDHSYDCEALEMNGGKMDHYVTGVTCARTLGGLQASTSPAPGNFAIADATTAKTYHDWASQYAMADRYFQPLIGQTSANDMYFAVAKWQFKDNEVKPACNGKGCIAPGTPTKTFTGITTIADVIVGAGHSFAVYAEGLDAMWKATLCPALPADCTLKLPPTPNPCLYDCSDIPFEYYDQWLDKPGTMKDWTMFKNDIAGNSLPSLSYIKFATYHNEHPGYGNKLSTSIALVKQAVDAVMASKYASDTLILVAWDEGGGFYDHVAPPGVNPVDGKPYGTRVPFLALGRFAKKGGHVSHVVLEHSSVVKFLELNFTGKTGQLAARDVNVNNIGSLLDPAETGLVIPE